LSTPVTTVLMPAYDAHATVRESVESVLAQTVDDLEIVVVDDASRVPIATALRGVDDPRLRVIRRDRNGGPCAARNDALRVARSPLVSQLDADDLWQPDYLESVLPRLEDPAVGLVYSNVAIRRHPDGRDTGILDSSDHPVDSFPRICDACEIPSATPTFRTHAARAVGGYASWLPTTGEYHLYLKLALAGWRFAYVDRRLATYTWFGPESGVSNDRTRARREALWMWVAFMARHPLTPGPRRQVRLRLALEIEATRGRVRGARRSLL
jgi:glycosyltransferase involved in cell wall biosynthesis